MYKIRHILSVAVLLSAFTGVSAPVIAADEAVIKEGKALTFNRKKGNCLACHMIVGGDLPGNIGPPLIAMKARFPDVAKLKAQIAEPRTLNPNTIMPPFGAHGILTDAEIDKVVAYIHSL
ncbi:MAG: sulfur oxidation c-type cytochrome SoxX [Leucothrix sp.]